MARTGWKDGGDDGGRMLEGKVRREQGAKVWGGWKKWKGSGSTGGLKDAAAREGGTIARSEGEGG